MKNKNVFEYHDDLFRDDGLVIEQQLYTYIEHILKNKNLNHIEVQVIVPENRKMEEGLVGIEIKFYNVKTDHYIKFPIGKWRSMDIQYKINKFLDVVI